MPAERAVRDTPICKYNRDVSAAGLAQEMWPDFRFQDNYASRLNRADDASHNPCPVERKIENSISEINALPGESLSGSSSSRNHQGRLGKFDFQPLGKRQCGQHFSHGNGVDPNTAGTFQSEFGRNFTEPFAQ